MYETQISVNWHKLELNLFSEKNGEVQPNSTLFSMRFYMLFNNLIAFKQH